MAKSIRRVALRTSCVLLAGGIVVASTYAITPSYDPRRAAAEEAKAEAKAEAEQAKKLTPATGSEEALLRMIVQGQRGNPDYAHMSRDLADRVRQQLPQVGRQLSALGPLQSIVYVGGNAHNDIYKVTYRNGWLRWGVSIGKDGIVDGLWFNDGRPSPPPTPQDWIDDYASFSMSNRATRMATQFGILLAAAVFGRFALRLRL